MKVNVISYEEINDWICGKIAKKLYESLVDLGVDAKLSNKIDESCDINHHVIYTGYNCLKYNTTINTIVITHIDNTAKLKKLNKALEAADMGICMSSLAIEYLEKLGVSKEKLDFAIMGQDGNAIERKFTVAITTRLYPDGRKNESYLVRLSEYISPKDFKFKIMGFGWVDIVEKLKNKGFEVEYHQDFHYDNYKLLLSESDYYLYMGNDEGSAGFVDALAAGLKTIVIPQGFHVDAKDGITFPFRSFEDLVDVFENISQEKRILTDSVSSWTWNNYAKQHLEIWNRLKSNETLPQLMQFPHQKKSLRLILKLFISSVKQKIKLVSNLGKEYQSGSRYYKKKWR